MSCDGHTLTFAVAASGPRSVNTHRAPGLGSTGGFRIRTDLRPAPVRVMALGRRPGVPRRAPRPLPGPCSSRCRSGSAAAVHRRRPSVPG